MVGIGKGDQELGEPQVQKYGRWWKKERERTWVWESLYREELHGSCKKYVVDAIRAIVNHRSPANFRAMQQQMLFLPDSRLSLRSRGIQSFYTQTMD